MLSSGFGQIMRRREFIKTIVALATTWPLATRAQQPTLPVIGFLSVAGGADEYQPRSD
jgi:putative ABC transport system substrate-binding protein